MKENECNPSITWEELRLIPSARMMLGCCWGRLVATQDDAHFCEAQAKRIIVLHDDSGSIDLKLCEEHALRVEAESTPHKEET